MLTYLLILLCNFNQWLSSFADALEGLLPILVRIEHLLTKMLPVLIGIIAMVSFTGGYLLSKI